MIRNEFCFDCILPRTEFTDAVYDCGYFWRGSYRYFAAYSSEQINAVAKLVDNLCGRFDVPRQTSADHLFYKPELHDFQGIISHHHVRNDKSDVHPGFECNRVVDVCELGIGLMMY
jgi:hypothetical protein